MDSPKNLKGAGAGFLGVGIAFLVIAMTGQSAFIGVGMAFLSLGVVFLARSRQGG
jgi:hypothetical protein